jgi:hypothetical protein
MTPACTSPSPTLKSVQEKFNHWRATRGKRTKIPDSLWELVVPLMSQYKNTEISTALCVNHSQLKRQLQQCLIAQDQPVSFVECSVPAHAPDISVRTLEFISKNGFPVKIGGISAEELLPIVSILLGH